MSVELDLDFQDYTPSASGNTGKQPYQTEVHVRIPSPVDSSSSLKYGIQGAKSILNIIQNVTNSSQKQPPPGGLTDEAFQRLIWLSARQKNKQSRPASANWGINYLAQYFDVTTNDVLERIVWSAIPIRKIGIDLDGVSDSELTASLTKNMDTGMNDEGNDTMGDEPSSDILEQLNHKRKPCSYMERFIQSRPDFYGPFWISSTLIFTVAILSNIVSYQSYRSKEYQASLPVTNGSVVPMIQTVYNQGDEWHYSMDELNMSASLIMSYVTLVPTFIWFLFWFRGCSKYYTLNETICAYGYSISIFVPLTVLLMIQTITFRYLAVGLASFLSGSVLFMSFLPVAQSDPNKASSHLVLIIVIVCHFLVAYMVHRIMLQ